MGYLECDLYVIPPSALYLQVPSNATGPLFQKSLDRHLKWVARYVLFGCAIDQNCNFVGVVLRPSLLQKAVSVF